MKRVSAIALALCAPLAVAQDPAPMTEFVGLTPEDIAFTPMASIPGASVALIVGHPSEEGFYIMRYRVPANTLLTAHHHDQDRHVTVISGTWAFGQGTSGACEDTQPMPPGSYIFHPSGKAHFDGSCTDEPIEVQVMGMGPVQNFIAR